MAEKRFWDLIDEARERTGHTEEQVRFLDEALARFSLTELIEFHETLTTAHRRACTDELWAAFDLAIGYAGNDTFTDARSWLILQGRARFDRVVADPDELATIGFDNSEELGLGEQFVATVVDHVEQRSSERGIAVDVEALDNVLDLQGPILVRNLADLRPRFPQIAAKYVPLVATELIPWPLIR